MKRLVTWAKCYLFCCSNNVKMQVYSAQTNKKTFVYASGFLPSLASVSFLAKLAWLIIVFFSIQMVNAVKQTLFRLLIQF